MSDTMNSLFIPDIQVSEFKLAELREQLIMMFNLGLQITQRDHGSIYF